MKPETWAKRNAAQERLARFGNTNEEARLHAEIAHLRTELARVKQNRDGLLDAYEHLYIKHNTLRAQHDALLASSYVRETEGRPWAAHPLPLARRSTEGGPSGVGADRDEGSSGTSGLLSFRAQN